MALKRGLIPKYEYKNLICQGCGKTFDSLKRNKKQRFCGRHCGNKTPRSSHGQTAGWNRGIRGEESHLFQRPCSNQTRNKIAEAHTGEKAYNWQESGAGYSSLHCWLLSHFEKPKECEQCGKSDVRLEWANVSGQYYRDRDDFTCLCVSCHWKFDREVPKPREQIFKNKNGVRLVNN